MDDIKELQEYDEFMLKLSDKVQELRHDYNNLSDRNKQRVYNELNGMLNVYGIVDIINNLSTPNNTKDNIYRG